MVVELTDEKLIEVFALIDKDGCGSIQSCEFFDFMKAIGLPHITQFEAKILFNLSDTDAKGKVSLTEIKAMWEKQYNDMIADAFGAQSEGSYDFKLKDYLKAMFRIADTEKSGYISKDELKDLLKNGNELLKGSIHYNRYDEIMKGVHIDENGRVNYDEKFEKSAKRNFELMVFLLNIRSSCWKHCIKLQHFAD